MLDEAGTVVVEKIWNRVRDRRNSKCFFTNRLCHNFELLVVSFKKLLDGRVILVSEERERSQLRSSRCYPNLGRKNSLYP